VPFPPAALEALLPLPTVPDDPVEPLLVPFMPEFIAVLPAPELPVLALPLPMFEEPLPMLPVPLVDPAPEFEAC